MGGIFISLKSWYRREKSYLEHWFELDERLRFMTVGIGNMTLRYLIFVGLGLWLSVEHYQWILLGSWLMSSVVAFWALKTLVFATKGNHLKEYLKSLSVWIISYFLNAGILELLIKNWSVSAYLAQAAAIVIITIINYLLFKHYAFKQKKRYFWERLYGVFD